MSGALALAAARADPVGDGPKIGEGQLKSKKAVKLSKPSGEKSRANLVEGNLEQQNLVIKIQDLTRLVTPQNQEQAARDSLINILHRAQAPHTSTLNQRNTHSPRSSTVEEGKRNRTTRYENRIFPFQPNKIYNRITEVTTPPPSFDLN
jgi:hypothetical protein